MSGHCRWAYRCFPKVNSPSSHSSDTFLSFHKEWLVCSFGVWVWWTVRLLHSPLPRPLQTHPIHGGPTPAWHDPPSWLFLHLGSPLQHQNDQRWPQIYSVRSRTTFWLFPVPWTRPYHYAKLARFSWWMLPTSRLCFSLSMSQTPKIKIRIHWRWIFPASVTAGLT